MAVDPPRPTRTAEEAIRRVDINLGHACNQRCLFCVQAGSGTDQKRWVPLPKLIEELTLYARKGVRGLGLLGGEPSIYPHLPEALEAARDLGFNDITINTNGFRLADEAFARNVNALGINRFCFSIHSEIPEVEDLLSGKKGAFVRKIRAIRNLHKLRSEGRSLTISVNAVLNRLTYPTIDRFIALMIRLKVTDIRLNCIRPEGGAENNREIVPLYSEVMPKLMELVARNERTDRIRLSFGEIPPCVFPAPFLARDDLRRRYIGEYSDVRTYVSSFGVGPTNDRAPGEPQRFVWQDLKTDELKTLSAACKRCVFLSACGGVWTNYIAMYGEAEFSPIPPAPE